jgi:hypothetical protein
MPMLLALSSKNRARKNRRNCPCGIWVSMFPLNFFRLCFGGFGFMIQGDIYEQFAEIVVHHTLNPCISFFVYTNFALHTKPS